MFLGIDIGGTKIEFAYFDGDTVQIIQREATPNSYENLLSRITEVVSDLQYVERIGIGFPGTYSGDSIIWVPNIPYLNKRQLTTDISKKLNVKVASGNDGQLALLGESWKGAATDVTNAVLFSIGTGIGGAIMLRKKIVRGRSGAAGAFGWLNLDITQEPIKDHGYLEYHASGSALKRIGATMTPPLSPIEIADKAKRGDPACVQVMDGIGNLLGASIGMVASIIDPEKVIISGGLSDAFDLFEKQMKQKYAASRSNGISDLTIVKSELGNQSGVYGAIRLAMVQDRAWV